MKKIPLLFLLAVSVIACKSGDKKAVTAPDNLSPEEKQKVLNDTASYTSIEWIDPIIQNLGKLVKDQSIEVSFRFKNSGNKILLIESVSAQCGCTIPEKPEKPFAPGEEGIIKAKFNGSGSGTISKQIYVKANTSPSKDHTLTFTGDIQEK